MIEDTRKVQQAIVAGGSREKVKQRRRWRAGRKLGEHIPAPLWSAALGAAKELGLHRVAIELHLDYAGLKRRFEGTGLTPPRGERAPRFVELLAPVAALTTAPEPARCVVEMDNARGAKMRVALSGHGLASLAGLCSAFWSA